MHIPKRMCIACREMKQKSELIRIVKSGDTVTLDISQKLGGRGAYICKNAACLKKARKQKALERALQCEIEETVFDLMLKQLEEDSD